MDKVMAIGLLLLFCIVFLAIDEGSGIAQHCRSKDDPRPVSTVILKV